MPNSGQHPTESVLKREIDQEQGYVTRLYEVLDAARSRAAADLRLTHGGPTTGTDQAATERESFARTYSGRHDQLLTVERGLCFGRLDSVGGETSYIGRIGLFDDDYDPLLLDWRAPVAEPFYRATTEDPMGVFRRRHLRLTGRTVTAVDDDVLDLAALADRDHDQPDRGGRALRLAVGPPHRPDVGDRRNHPGGAGRHHPCGPARGPGGPGWPGHREDGRRPAPRRVPALHPPRAARPARGAADRSERDLPPLHRAGAALARGDRGGPVHHRRAASRGGRDGDRVPGGEPAQGSRGDGRRDRPRRPGRAPGPGPRPHARASAHPALVIPGATCRRGAGPLYHRSRRPAALAGESLDPGRRRPARRGRRAVG